MRVAGCFSSLLWPALELWPLSKESAGHSAADPAQELRDLCDIPLSVIVPAQEPRLRCAPHPVPPLRLVLIERT